MARVLTVFLGAFLLLACGDDKPRESRILGTGVDKDEKVDGALHKKTLISRAYAIEGDQINIHTEPFRIKPFSRTKRVFLTGWRTDAVADEGSVMPEDIQCHTILSEEPLYQENENMFRGLCTDGFTPEFLFPKGFGMPVEAGERLTFQPMFNNRHELGCRVRMRLEVDYLVEGPETQGMRGLRVFVVSVAYPDMYYVPPNQKHVVRREFEAPFTGRVHAIGGHIHPMGDHLELKRVRDQKVMYTATLTKAKAIKDRRLNTYASVEGFFVKEGDTYQMTSVYINTSDEQQDAMGGFFIFYDPEGKPDA